LLECGDADFAAYLEVSEALSLSVEHEQGVGHCTSLDEDLNGRAGWRRSECPKTGYTPPGGIIDEKTDGEGVMVLCGKYATVIC